MKLNAIYPVLCSERLVESRDFYVNLLGLRVTFENDWYISLASTSEPPQQIAFVDRAHESVPKADRVIPTGCLVTVETADVDAAHERAQAAQLPMELELRDEAWGQRHFIVRDPNGVLVDVVKVIAPSEAYAASYVS